MVRARNFAAERSNLSRYSLSLSLVWGCVCFLTLFLPPMPAGIMAAKTPSGVKTQFFVNAEVKPTEPIGEGAFRKIALNASCDCRRQQQNCPPPILLLRRLALRHRRVCDAATQLRSCVANCKKPEVFFTICEQRVAVLLRFCRMLTAPRACTTGPAGPGSEPAGERPASPQASDRIKELSRF